VLLREDCIYKAYGGDQGELSGTEVKHRRLRLVLGDCPGRPSAVNLCPFVGVDLSVTDRLYSCHRADTDVKLIKLNCNI